MAEPWRCRALNSGPLWIGLPATGKRLETTGTIEKATMSLAGLAVTARRELGTRLLR